VPKGLIRNVNKDIEFHWDNLLFKLRSTKEEDFVSYILLSSKDKRIVKRSGYYLGYLLAKEIGKTRTLSDMARMSKKEVLPLLELNIKRFINKK